MVDMGRVTTQMDQGLVAGTEMAMEAMDTPAMEMALMGTEMQATTTLMEITAITHPPTLLLIAHTDLGYTVRSQTAGNGLWRCAEISLGV